jgi:predicted nuclease of predicted toxin-antitoxin system
MDFIADMGVSIRVVSWLRNQGFDAVHLRDRGLQRLPDKEVFELAIQENRIVLTFDLDFGEIVALSSGAIISVLLFRSSQYDDGFRNQATGSRLGSDCTRTRRWCDRCD